MKMKSKKWLTLIFVSFLWGCSPDGSEKRAEPEPVQGVEVAVVQPTAVEDYFAAVGTVRPRRTTTLSSKVVGTVVIFPVSEGDRVKEGQTLVEIESRDLRAELQGAEAALEEIEWAIRAAGSAVVAAEGQRDLAAATFQRYESLVARGSIAPQEFDEVRTKYQVAEAEVARAGENLRALKARREQAKARLSHTQALLSYARITSPFGGIVTAKMAEIGTVASPGTPLLTVEERGPYRLESQVGESQISLIRLRGSVEISLDAVDQRLVGTVAEIVPAADPQSRTFTVKIDLPSRRDIRSGLYGKARFPLGERKILAAPPQALLHRGQLVGVYVIDRGGIARFRLVKTGKEYGDRTEVLSGLSAGERIVTQGVERVSEGSRVGS